MKTSNIIEVEKRENTWMAKMWFGKTAPFGFLPIPFTPRATKALIKRTLQEINPKHTIVFN